MKRCAILVECGDEEVNAKNPVLAYRGWNTTRLGRGGLGADDHQGRELADSSRV